MLLKYNKIKLVIDNYGDISRNLGKLIELSETYQVRYEVQELQTWYQPEPTVKKDFSQSYLKQVFHDCIFRNCFSILNGKLYHCLASGHIDNLGLSSGVTGDYIQIQGIQWNTAALKKEI